MDKFLILRKQKVCKILERIIYDLFHMKASNLKMKIDEECKLRTEYLSNSIPDGPLDHFDEHRELAKNEDKAYEEVINLINRLIEQYRIDIRAEQCKRISADCMDVLRHMPNFSWRGYIDGLINKGYTVEYFQDENGDVLEYSINTNTEGYYESVLGVGRNLSAKNIYSTHAKLHKE